MKKAKSILALLMAFVMLMSFAAVGSAADAVATEKEDNGDFKTATAFGFATKIKGVLGTSDDEDYYSFTADSAGLATVTIAHNLIDDANKELAYFEVTVYDSAEKEQLVFRSTGTEKETVSQSFAISNGATYFVKVAMGTIHSDVLEYSIIASFDKGALVEKEPNNIASRATNLELSTKDNAKHYYGTIASTGADVDYYRVAPAKNGVIYLYIYNGNIPADFKATLYTHYEIEDGVLIEEEISSITINSNEEYAKSVAIGVYGKEYMLKIEGLNGKTGDYRTRVFYNPVSDAEMEYNNSEYLANSILVGSHLRGTISQAKDVDFFRFTAKKDEIHEITLSLAEANPDATGSWLITVIDGATEAIVEKTEKIDVKANDTYTVKFDKLVGGRNYYIRLEKGGTLNTDIYKLSVTSTKPENPDKPVSDGDFFKQIVEYFTIFWGNFSEWVDEVNFIGIITGILPGIVKALPELFTWLFSLIG